MSIGMLSEQTAIEARRGPSLWLAALVGVVVMLLIDGAQGFVGLSNARGDNDSLLRLVEVRDLLAGQGWFDLTQYRMGPPGGFEMHWSRLVDGPIAAIALLATWATGSSEMGETAAMIVWPAITFFLALYAIVRAAHRLAGDDAILPAVVLGVACLYSLGVFMAGALDHHNIQLALVLLSVAMLAEARINPMSAAIAGTASGLSIAIGMETVPYVAAIGLAVAAWFLFTGASAATTARNFGLGFAGAALAALLATVPLDRWSMPACDAFSIVQFVAAVTAGLGLAAVTMLVPRGGLLSRGAALVAVGACAAGLILTFFPQCIAKPYAAVDPTIASYLFDFITEAQSLPIRFASDPFSLVGAFATPLLGLFVIALIWRKRGLDAGLALVGAVLLVATLAGTVQMRCTVFAAAVAVIPLSIWVTSWRQRANGGGAGANVAMVLAWILAMNFTWTAAAAVLTENLGAREEVSTLAEPVATDRPQSICQWQKDYALLAAMPPMNLLADIDMASEILAYTHHRALSGLYHRNPGNVTAYYMQIAPPDEARKLVVENGMDGVVICRDADDSPDLTEKFPDGLHARLRRGDIPVWLEAVAETKGQAVEVYRVLKSTP